MALDERYLLYRVPSSPSQGDSYPVLHSCWASVGAWSNSNTVTIFPLGRVVVCGDSLRNNEILGGWPVPGWTVNPSGYSRVGDAVVLCPASVGLQNLVAAGERRSLGGGEQWLPQ